MFEEISGTAIVLTQGFLKGGPAKTAHGLIRGSDRFRIMGIIDEVYAGRDAGEVLDGIPRGIPVYASLQEALNRSPEKIAYCLIGIAPKGGKLPTDMIRVLEECLLKGISLVSGLHDYLNDIPSLVALAREHGATLTDVRRSPPKSELHFWSGSIYQVRCPVIAVLGMDTKMGKRTTTRLIREACRNSGIRAEMVSTGQTGWMQDGRFGFVLDSVYNDFVSGELEYAVTSCFQQARPDLILLEGQSGLRNPSGPCGSEYLLSAGARQVVLQFAPKRVYYDDNPAWGKIPSVKSEIELIELYGSQVIAVTMNTEKCTLQEARIFQEELAAELDIPVLLPLEDGVKGILPVLKDLIQQFKQ